MGRFCAWLLGLGSLLALSLAVVAKPQPPTIIPPQPRPLNPDGSTVMDEPLRLMAAARQAFQNVQDYTCVLIKRERMRGQMQADQVISMKVRQQPFSVYLRWEEPRPLAGQEACYVAGRNNGMMRVHTTGLVGALGGWVSVDPRDPRVMENSRHSITEAGIGNLLERYGTRWEEERRLNVTDARVADFVYNNRPCRRVELIHPPGGQFTYCRSLLYFDKETHLPIRVENYDWPRAGRGNAADGELVEVYSYIDVRPNVGLRDDAFDY
jgi:Protein of unknown function (DUF1571)